jgi:hypothetical protein
MKWWTRQKKSSVSPCHWEATSCGKHIYQGFGLQMTETQFCLAPARDTFIGSCNLKSESILEYYWIFSKVFWIWIFPPVSHFCLPWFWCCFTGKLSPHDWKHWLQGYRISVLEEKGTCLPGVWMKIQGLTWSGSCATTKVRGCGD